jgi:hypothetical protein
VRGADLSARIRSRGFEVWRTATAPLFDFGAASISPVEAELDRRALERNWRTTLTEAAEAPKAAAEPVAAPAKTRQRARRRRRVA